MPHRDGRARRARVGVLAVVASLLGAVVPLGTAGAAPPPYRPPVQAAVLDGFRPPATPYGPGNRGLEYDTLPGTEVRVAADGQVTFAGQVAGSRHVTVLHDDGVRTTYSFLDRVNVVAGQRLRQGTVVGTTVGRLHMSARTGDAYFDPASLFDDDPPRVRLVPFDEPPGRARSGEQSAIRQLIGAAGGIGSSIGQAVGEALGSAGSAASTTAEWLVSHAEVLSPADLLAQAQLARTLAHYGQRFLPVLAAIDRIRTGIRIVSTAWEVAHRQCTAGASIPEQRPERRVAVLVGGLGSTSDAAAIDDLDTGALGYDPGDVLRFSYAGGRTPAGLGSFADIEASAYDASSSQQDLHRSARLLADLIEQVAARAAGAPIDLFAHSQGGIAARLSLLELQARHGTDWLSRLGLVATLGTPHGGADAATAIHAISQTLPGAVLLAGIHGSGLLPLSARAPSASQLSEVSGVVKELQDNPVADSVRFLSVAARGDLVVPVPRTRVQGKSQVVVPLAGPAAHDRLPGSAEARRELGLALSGDPPACKSFTTALADELVGESISLGEDGLGVLASVGASLEGMARVAP